MHGSRRLLAPLNVVRKRLRRVSTSLTILFTPISSILGEIQLQKSNHRPSSADHSKRLTETTSVQQHKLQEQTTVNYDVVVRVLNYAVA